MAYENLNGQLHDKQISTRTCLAFKALTLFKRNAKTFFDQKVNKSLSGF